MQGNHCINNKYVQKPSPCSASCTVICSTHVGSFVNNEQFALSPLTSRHQVYQQCQGQGTGLPAIKEALAAVFHITANYSMSVWAVIESLHITTWLHLTHARSSLPHDASTYGLSTSPVSMHTNLLMLKPTAWSLRHLHCTPPTMPWMQCLGEVAYSPCRLGRSKSQSLSMLPAELAPYTMGSLSYHWLPISHLME